MGFSHGRRSHGSPSIRLEKNVAANRMMVRTHPNLHGCTSFLPRFYFASTSLLLRFYFAATSLLLRFYFASTSLLLRFYCASTSLLLRFYFLSFAKYSSTNILIAKI